MNEILRSLYILLCLRYIFVSKVLCSNNNINYYIEGGIGLSSICDLQSQLFVQATSYTVAEITWSAVSMWLLETYLRCRNNLQIKLSITMYKFHALVFYMDILAKIIIEYNK